MDLAVEHDGRTKSTKPNHPSRLGRYIASFSRLVAVCDRKFSPFFAPCDMLRYRVFFSKAAACRLLQHEPLTEREIA